MAGAAPTYLPLDLDALRSAVSAGRTVRVGVLPTGQFPDGTAGRVRGIGSPETDGPEFIQVELVVGGAKDVVPFAPGDLSPLRRGQAAPEPLVRPVSRRPPRAARPTRAAPTLSLVPASAIATAAPVRSAGASAGSTVPTTVAAADRIPDAGPPAPAPGTDVASPTADTPASGASAPSSPTPVRPGRNRRAAGTPTPTPVPTAAPTPAGATGSGPAPTGAPPAGPRTTARRGDRTKRQPIAVTLSTTEPDHTGWSVQVTVGSRTVVKPTPVHPAQAWTLVTGLGQPEVEQFVAGALAEHRRQAEERADRLARELADARAELAAYPDL